MQVPEKHYTEISQVKIIADFERLAVKNGYIIQVDGFGGGLGFGNDHDMITFKELPGVIINALYELDGTTLHIELENPDDNEYFTVFDGKTVLSIFNFLKKCNGNFDVLIDKHRRKLKKEREKEYTKFKNQTVWRY